MAAEHPFLSSDQYSCSVCLDVLKEPVSLICGHNYCLSCINDYWDNLDKDGTYNCPQCRRTFNLRPEINQNAMLKDIIEKLKVMESSITTSQGYTGPDDVPCDVCMRNTKAVKTCLTCLASYCEIHLNPHRISEPLKRHKLDEPTGNMEEKLCKKHHKVLEIFCRTDGTLICLLCVATDHKSHDTVTPEEERAGRQSQLENRKVEMKKKILDKQETLEEMKQTVMEMQCSAERKVQENEETFRSLFQSIEKLKSEVTKLIKDHEGMEVRKAKELIERLEKEIMELKRRDAELSKLSQSDDHICFLQKFPTLCVPPEDEDIIVNSDLLPETLRKDLIILKENLEEVNGWEFLKMSESEDNISGYVLENLRIKDRFLKSDDTPPRLSNIYVHFNTFNQRCTLICIVSDFYPKEISITWLRIKKSKIYLSNESDDWNPTVHHYGPAMTNNKYSLVSQAEFIPQSLSDLEDMQFICRVEHKTLKGKTIEESCPVIPGLQKRPIVSCIKMIDYKGPRQPYTLSCSIQDFYPKDIKVTWQRADENGPNISDLSCVPQRGEWSYNLESKASIIPKTKSELKEAQYICKIEHETLNLKPIEIWIGKLDIPNEGSQWQEPSLEMGAICVESAIYTAAVEGFSRSNEVISLPSVGFKGNILGRPKYAYK